VSLTFAVGSPEETLALGRALGRVLRPGGVVLLTGDLGAGKTVLTKGIAEGVGIADPSRVVSPTFAIVNVYDGRVPMAHVDLYRLADAAAIDGIGLEEYLPWHGVTVVEWGERLPEPPGQATVIVLRQVEEGEGRLIEIDRPPRGFSPAGFANAGEGEEQG
jgi:tRNA threonylcarbamoyladenosine biosynthesis protein TsaE